jgi:hypothetical protein
MTIHVNVDFSISASVILGTTEDELCPLFLENAEGAKAETGPSTIKADG